MNESEFAFVSHATARYLEWNQIYQHFRLQRHDDSIIRYSQPISNTRYTLKHGNTERLRTSIELAHQFGLTVVAEGVEDAQVLERLHALGCEAAQGYYISKPLPSAEFLSWAEQWSDREAADIVSIVTADRSKMAKSAS